MLLDLFLIFATLRVIISRESTLSRISNKLNKYGASKELIQVAARKNEIKIIDLPK